MKNLFTKFLIISLLSIIVGCVKQPIINQGQTIDSDSFSQLQIGMSREQVRLILGSPALIDTFNSNQWFYYFSNAKINEQKIKKQGTLQLTFKQDILDQINQTGDLVVKSADANIQGGTVITKPTQKKRGILSRLFK